MSDREALVRSRRRLEALDSLDLKRERERALTERLEQILRDLEGWRVDEEAFARMQPEDVRILRSARFAASSPEEDARVRFEGRIAELENEIAEARRRQEAYARYAEALGDGS